MKFLIDENLPPVLAEFIRHSGFEARHVNDFGSELPISDDALRRFALHKNWIVVTKDDDFVKSYVSRKIPEKLIYVFDFHDKKSIMKAFKLRWIQLVDAISNGELVEINPEELKIHF